MFVRLDFYDISYGSSLDAFLEFEKRVSARYTEVAESRGSQYTGLYQAHYLRTPEEVPGYLRERLPLVGFYIVEGTVVERRRRKLPPPPEDFRAILAEVEPFSDPERSHVIELVPSQPVRQKKWDLTGRGWVIEVPIGQGADSLRGSPDELVFGEFLVLEDESLCRLRLDRAAPKGKRPQDQAWLEPLVPARSRILL